MQALCIAANSGKRLVVSWQTSSQMLVSHSSKTEFHTCSYRILCNFRLQSYYFFLRYANISAKICDIPTFATQSANNSTKITNLLISYKPYKPKHKLFFQHPPIYQQFMKSKYKS